MNSVIHTIIINNKIPWHKINQTKKPVDVLLDLNSQQKKDKKPSTSLPLGKFPD